MISLLEYIHEALQPVFEGGAGGHLAASGCKLETFDRVQEVIDALNHTESI